MIIEVSYLWTWIKDPLVRFQVLTAVSMMTASWDIAPRSLVEVVGRFRGMYCLHHQGDESNDGGSTYLWNVVYFNETTKRYIPEGYSLPKDLLALINKAWCCWCWEKYRKSAPFTCRNSQASLSQRVLPYVFLVRFWLTHVCLHKIQSVSLLKFWGCELPKGN
jgi:hypothetical protein